MKKGSTMVFSVFIQRLVLLVMMLLILPFVSKTTNYICIDLIENCIQYEADLESETESENSKSSSMDDDFLFPISSFLLTFKEQSLASSFEIKIKNKITTDDPSPPPEMRFI